MGKNKKSYAKLLPTFTIIFSLTFASLSAIILSVELDSIADEQENYLGQALSSQLAKVSRNSIINQDKLSLQIEVDDMLTIEGIQYVAVHDASRRLLVKATKSANRTSLASNATHTYTSAITIENATAGYALVRFDQEFFAAYFQTLRFAIAFLFASIFFILIYLSAKIGKILSFRLNHLIQQLPGDNKETMDELSALEHRLKPLMATRKENQQPYAEQKVEDYALLAIDCKNLTILKTRVNPEHLESVMSQFDILVNDAAEIYGATRLSAGQRSIYLQFKGKSEYDDHPLRALYCATAIHDLSKKLLDTQGIKLELASVISNDTQKYSRSQILNESHCEAHLNSLQLMLEQAVDGEILLDAPTKSHGSLQDISLYPPSEKSILFRVEELNEDSKELISQQIAILGRDM